MRTQLVTFVSLFAVACHVPVTVNGTIVPAGQQPTAMSAAQPAAEQPATLGTQATGAPASMSSAPSTMPAMPSSTTIVNNISVSITSNLSFAFASDDDCSAYGLGEGLAYCDDAAPSYVTMCDGGKIYFFDCASYGAAFNCGYTFEGDGLVACVDAPDAKISDAIIADKSFAYTTNIPCTAADESYAECQGSYAYFCSGGDVFALDCASYSDDKTGAPATCGETDHTIDCHF